MPPRALLLVAALALTGCAHAVRLEAVPAGATIEVNGDLLGPAPVLWEERSGFRRTYTVVLRAEGYRTRTVALTQAVKFPTFCCLPLLPWAWELPEDRYRFALEPEDGRSDEERIPGR